MGSNSLSLPDAIDCLRPAVVQIMHTITGLEPERVRELGGRGAVFSVAMGSGFIVSPDARHVVTAEHVLDEIEALQQEPTIGKHLIGVGLAYPNTEKMRGRFRSIPFGILATDQRHDLAVLRLNEHPAIRDGMEPNLGDGPIPLPYGHVEIGSDRPRDGEVVAGSGYPSAACDDHELWHDRFFLGGRYREAACSSRPSASTASRHRGRLSAGHHDQCGAQRWARLPSERRAGGRCLCRQPRGAQWTRGTAEQRRPWPALCLAPTS